MANNLDISVEVPTPEQTETPPEPAAPVTVVESANSGVDPTVMQELIEARERDTNAEQRIEELQAQLDTVSTDTAVASATAGMAVEETHELAVAVEEATAEPEISPDDDEEPRREHLFWRSFR